MSFSRLAALALTALLFVVALGATPATRPAAAEAEIDFAVFYDSLAPQGDWVPVETYGWAWVPANVDYSWRPYTLGHWEWVDPYGWTWVSDESFGWAVYHYGRWVWLEDYGWAWVPGVVWAPAWVVFRYGDPWVGWAPLPPTPGWRFDIGIQINQINVQVNVGAFAWNFVPVRYFAEPDLPRHFAATAVNPYLVERTTWSTRLASAEGGIANLSVDVAAVERARGAKVQRRRLKEAQAPEAKARVEGDSVVVFKPKVAEKPPTAKPPAPRQRPEGAPPGRRPDREAWLQQRREAINRHMEAQRKAVEREEQEQGQEAAKPPPPGRPPAPPGGQPGADDGAKRREAAAKALEEERKRLEALLERQRRRMEETPPQEPPPSPPPDDGKKKDEPGKKGKGQDDDKDKDKEE